MEIMVDAGSVERINAAIVGEAIAIVGGRDELADLLAWKDANLPPDQSAGIDAELDSPRFRHAISDLQTMRANAGRVAAIASGMPTTHTDYKAMIVRAARGDAAAAAMIDRMGMAEINALT